MIQTILCNDLLITANDWPANNNNTIPLALILFPSLHLLFQAEVANRIQYWCKWFVEVAARHHTHTHTHWRQC